MKFHLIVDDRISVLFVVSDNVHEDLCWLRTTTPRSPPNQPSTAHPSQRKPTTVHYQLLSM